MKVKDIKKLILNKDIKVVSFDVFDTLIQRPVVEPVDLFNIIGYRTQYGDDFKDIRIMSERIAKNNRPFYYNEVNLSEIYDEFAKINNITREEVDLYEKVECEVELEYVFPRNTIKELFELALEIGKKVIIVSDMYLSKEQIINMLKKCGYYLGENGYSDIYVSGDCRLTKSSGLLYEKVKADLSIEGIDAEEILHIGDNYNSDFKVAKSKGLVAAHIRKCSDSFKKNTHLKKILRNVNYNVSYNSYDDSVFIYGALMMYLFDDPDVEYNKDSMFGQNNDSLRNMGAIIFAPFVIELCKWIIEDMNKNSKEELLLVMRDGYVLSKVFKLLEKSYNEFPKINKMYASRMLLHPFYGNKDAGLSKLIAARPLRSETTVGEIISNYLFVEEGSESEKNALKIFQYNGLKSKDSELGKVDKFYTYMNEFDNIFKENSKIKENEVRAYFNEFINTSNELAIFDISYTNSVSRMIKDEFNKANTGYSPFAKPKMESYRKSGYDLKSLIEYSNATTSKYKALNFMVEHVFSSQEGSVIGVKMIDEKPVFSRKKVDVFDEIDKIQRGIFDFIEYFIDMFKKDFMHFTFDKVCFYENIINLTSNPTKKDANLLKSVTFSINHHRNTIFTYDTLMKSNNKNIKIDGANNYEKLVDKDEVINLLENSIDNIENVFYPKENKNTIIFIGGMPAFDKGSCNYINLLNYYTEETNCLFLSTISTIGLNKVKTKMSTEFLCMPKFLSKDNYFNNIEFNVTKDIKKIIEKKLYLKEAIDIIKMQANDIKAGFPEIYVYYCYKYFDKVLEVYDPKSVVIWNVFSANHYIYKKMCEEKIIEVKSMEFGVLPGTFCFEDSGQMGESYVATRSEEFNQLVINKDDIDKSKDLLSYLKKSKLNRNIQVSFDLKKYLKDKVKKDRPIITYYGQNDYESGILPYTENTEKFHSPIFKNSDEAAIYLSELCNKNDWNFIYKPHPKMVRLNKVDEIFEKNGTVVLNMVDINDLIDYSTVNVTILSQVSYVSLIREKATLMLGYNQLRDKNCAYEVYNKEKIEDTLKAAIENGYTKKQYNNFIEHVSRLNKYYLFDDLTEKPYKIGRDIIKCIEFLKIK